MGIGVTALIENPMPLPPGNPPVFEAFCELFFARGEGLQLQTLAGLSDDQPTYTVTDLSSRAKQRFDEQGAAEIRCSKVMLINADDDQVVPRSALLKGGIAPRVEAALASLRSLGPNARMVFWHTM